MTFRAKKKKPMNSPLNEQQNSSRPTWIAPQSRKYNCRFNITNSNSIFFEKKNSGLLTRAYENELLIEKLQSSVENLENKSKRGNLNRIMNGWFSEVNEQLWPGNSSFLFTIWKTNPNHLFSLVCSESIIFRTMHESSSRTSAIRSAVFIPGRSCFQVNQLRKCAGFGWSYPGHWKRRIFIPRDDCAHSNVRTPKPEKSLRYWRRRRR